MKGKRVLIVDDVISTGGSLESLENLVGETYAIIPTLLLRVTLVARRILLNGEYRNL